jgi:hypothetical protein
MLDDEDYEKIIDAMVSMGVSFEDACVNVYRKIIGEVNNDDERKK